MKPINLKTLITAFILLLLTITMLSCSEPASTDKTNNSLTDTENTNTLDTNNTMSPDDTSTTPNTMQTQLPETTVAPITKPPVTELNLTNEEGLSYALLRTKIMENPSLELLRADTLTLTADEYTALCKINPSKKLALITNVKFETITFDLSKSEIDISKKTISDKEAFDTLLSYFPSGKKLIMCDCNYTNEEMGTLREKHTMLDFAWKLYLGEKWTLRTDDEAFSVMIYNYNYTRMTSADIEVLKYCTNMRALDLGHQAITDLSVLGTLTELRVLILADNKVSDLTPLSNLKKLEYLELFVNRISDLSPLAECTSLLDLNFGWNRNVEDISCIYSLDKIERLWLPTTGVDEAQHDEIKANFPNAKIVFKDVDSVSSGWRTHPRYKPMRAMFTNNKYDENFASYKE